MQQAHFQTLNVEQRRNKLSDTDLRRLVMGCWLGKAVGGTLGMPYEGVRERLSLTFYDPVPTEMLPNDDLDLQVIYAYLLNRMSQPVVSSQALSAAWKHIGMSPDEYAVVKRNLKLGLHPPATGAYDNAFIDGMGAAIRTEIWACLAAGDPKLAAAYAYEDACMDHAGDGIYAAQFLAAVQAGAFVESDTDTLLDIGLSVIPPDCRISQGVRLVRSQWAKRPDPQAIYPIIRDQFSRDNFTDVTLNIPFIVLGWLASGGDFGRGICQAVNCGEDTDCTGATLGALLGILNPDGIDSKWLAPIGQKLVLSPSITGVEHPGDLDGFTDLILQLRQRIDYAPPTPSPMESTDHLEIAATVGFTQQNELLTPLVAPPMPEPAKRVWLEGANARLSGDSLCGRIIHVNYTFRLDKPQSAYVMLASAHPVRVYVDGQYVFGRDGGPMRPGFHYAPLHTCKLMSFDAGEHELRAVFHRPPNGQDLTWTAGIGTGTERALFSDWIHDAFERKGNA